MRFTETFERLFETGANKEQEEEHRETNGWPKHSPERPGQIFVIDVEICFLFGFGFDILCHVGADAQEEAESDVDPERVEQIRSVACVVRFVA